MHNAGRNYQIPRWPAAIGTAVMSALKRFVPRWLPSFLLPNFPFLGALSVCWVDAASLLLGEKDNESDACILSLAMRRAGFTLRPLTGRFCLISASPLHAEALEERKEGLFLLQSCHCILSDAVTVYFP